MKKSQLFFLIPFVLFQACQDKKQTEVIDEQASTAVVHALPSWNDTQTKKDDHRFCQQRNNDG